MKNLRYAFKAFFTILIGRDHVYSDDKYTSIAGKRHKIEELGDNIRNMWNDEVRQQNLLHEAKEILNKN